MSPYVEEQLNTMIKNMPEKTGKSIEEWFAVLKEANLAKHGEMMKLLKLEYSVTHGFAGTIVQLYRQNLEGGPPSEEDLVAAQYSKKQDLKPIYNKVIKIVEDFGDDVEIAPKKAYVSLRRIKQFAIIKPSTKTRVDLGFNAKDAEGTERFTEGNAFGGMCTHLVKLTSEGEVDEEVANWLKKAYDNAG